VRVDIKRFVTGPIDTNTYLLTSGKASLIVDPSSGCGEVVGHVQAEGLAVEAIVLTHGHFDHFLGIPEILQHFPNAEVWVHGDELPMIRRAEYNGSIMMGKPFAYSGATRELRETEVTIGSFTVGVRHVPGHSPGGCALLFDDACLSGDALFAGSVGRSDFPGGDHALLLDSIRTKLFVLAEETVVYPGHGNRTTIGREKRSNPFFSA